MVLEGVTLQGSLHEEIGLPNQDAFRLEQIDDYYAAVVCDGVSLKSDFTYSSSEIASAYCADHVMDYLKDNLRKHMDAGITESMLFDCFKSTAIGLEEELSHQGIPFYDCQTTVLLMLYRNGVLSTAMAGDGGVIFLTKDGDAGLLVTKLKTSSSVEPICYPQGWRFATVGDAQNPVVGAILATDGIFDNLVKSFRQQVHLNEAMIGELFAIDQYHETYKRRALEEIARRIETHDDKTVVVLIADSQDLPLRDQECDSEETPLLEFTQRPGGASQ